jgi:hypothetical protein
MAIAAATKSAEGFMIFSLCTNPAPRLSAAIDDRVTK